MSYKYVTIDVSPRISRPFIRLKYTSSIKQFFAEFLLVHLFNYQRYSRGKWSSGCARGMFLKNITETQYKTSEKESSIGVSKCFELVHNPSTTTAATTTLPHLF